MAKPKQLELEDAILRSYGRDCSVAATFDADGVQASSGHNALGQELPDPVPMAPPVGFSAGPSLADFIRRTIQSEISKRAADDGYETFEEAEDFDIEDDPLDPHTEYEAVFDPPVNPPGSARSAKDAPLAPEPSKSITEGKEGGSAKSMPSTEGASTNPPSSP